MRRRRPNTPTVKPLPTVLRHAIGAVIVAAWVSEEGPSSAAEPCRWKPSLSEALGAGNNGHAPDPELIRIGPRHALRFNDGDMGQGYTNDHVRVVAISETPIRPIGQFETAGSDSGTCSNDPKERGGSIHGCWDWSAAAGFIRVAGRDTYTLRFTALDRREIFDAGAPAVQLLPIDEAPEQADFFSFRAHLQAAIARHDVEAVLAVVHPTIKNSFGGDDGLDGFRRLWRPFEADSTLWAELGLVLALGGTFDAEDSFTAPYVFSRWPNQIDSFEHVVLVASDVRIREAPRADAATLTTLSFAILPVPRKAGVAEVEGWTPVEIDGGRVGYVSSRLARSPIDYRARFSKIGGRWQLVFFLAGD